MSTSPTPRRNTSTAHNRALATRLLSPSTSDWTFRAFLPAFRAHALLSPHANPVQLRRTAEVNYTAQLRRLGRDPRYADRANTTLARFQTGGENAEPTTTAGVALTASALAHFETHKMVAPRRSNRQRRRTPNNGGGASSDAAAAAATAGVAEVPPPRPHAVVAATPSASCSRGVPPAALPAASVSPADSTASTILLPRRTPTRLQLTAPQQLFIEHQVASAEVPTTPTEYAFDDEGDDGPATTITAANKQVRKLRAVVSGFQDELAKWVARDRCSAARIRALEEEVRGLRREKLRRDSVRRLLEEVRELGRGVALVEDEEEEDEEDEIEEVKARRRMDKGKGRALEVD